MWRRIVYVLIGIVTVNLVLMASMFVQARDADKCDINERGLVIIYDDDKRDRWEQASLPLEPTDLPPCKGRLETKLKISPG